MKQVFLVLLILIFTAFPVSSLDMTAPTVPEMGREYMPDNTESFGEGIWTIVKAGIAVVKPELVKCSKSCFVIAAVGLLLSLFQNLTGMAKQGVGIVAALLTGCVLLETGNSMIAVASEAVQTISEYGKLLLPVMAGTLAAQGCGATSAALYASSAVFCGILSKLISGIMVPGIYIFLSISVAGAAFENQMLGKLKEMILKLCSWALKTLLSFFTGFLAITGVVSGSTDAAAAKLTKAAISGMVPVVGGILSEATESVLVGAGMVKNTAGVYGLLAVASVSIGPFLQIGVRYLLLKLTAAFCELFSGKQVSQLLKDYSGAMGILLGMTFACTMLLFISVVCFMKGVG